MRAFENATTLSSGRFMYAFPVFWKFRKLLDIGTEKILRRSIKVVHEFADDIIRSSMGQRTGSKTGEDMLSKFISNEDNAFEILGSNVICFILAGRDTTSSALSWFFWLLSLNPDVQTNILKELEAIRARSGKNGGETYNFEELRDMHYLRAAILEAMSLYPPVPVDTRTCRSDDVLPDATSIGKNWFITYNTYAVGRMERIWGKNSCEFRPERWLENGICRQASPFKFPVFHAGPRMCLGKEMAYVQMKSIAASAIERFEIDVMNKEKRPEHVLSLTLRMKNGLRVNIKDRYLEVSQVN